MNVGQLIAALVSAAAAAAGVIVSIWKKRGSDNDKEKITETIDTDETESWGDKGSNVSVKFDLLPRKGVKGREELLDTLQRQFRKGGLVVLVGGGGMGKSTVARELARRISRQRGAENGPLLWEVRGDGREDIIPAFTTVARDAGASNSDLKAIRTSAPSGPDRLWEYLEHSSRGWLLIIDNADNPEFLASPAERGAKPPPLAHGIGWARWSSRGLVLVTSRVSAEGRRESTGLARAIIKSPWPARAIILEVKTLSDEAAAQILIDWAPGAGDEAQARALARRLGGLPLVLGPVGRYLASFDDEYSSFDAFRRALERDPRVLEALDLYPSDSDDVQRALVMFTWELSLSALSKRGLPQARPLLRLLSCYEPGVPIPVSLLKAQILAPLMHSSVDLTRHPRWAETPVGRVLEGLAGLGLIDPASLGDAKALVVHPVIADTNRIHLLKAERSGPRPALVRQTAVGLLAAALDSLTEDRPEDWPTFRMLHPHLRALLAVCAHAPGDSERPLDQDHLDMLIRVTGDTAMAYGQMRLPDTGIELVTSVLALTPDYRDSLNPTVLLARQQHAFLLGQNGHETDAELIYNDVLQAQLRIWSRDDPANLVVRQNLAASLAGQGRWKEAEAAFRDVLADEQRVLNKDHPTILDTRRGLAVMLCEQDSWAEAERALRALLEDERRVLGEINRTSLVTGFDLAQAIRHQRRRAEAKDAIHKLLAEAQQLQLGEDHLLTRTIREFREGTLLSTSSFSTPDLRKGLVADLFNQAVALTRQPDSQQVAAEAFRQVADRFSDDPDPAIRAIAAGARSSEAGLLDRQNRSEEALPVIEQAVSIYDQLASANPDAYREGLESARKEFTRIRHNVTVTLYNNAVALTRQPDSQQAAAEAFRQVADRFSHDPDPAIRATAADARSTEAGLLDRQNRSEEALPVIEQAVSIYDQLASANPDAYQEGLESARKEFTRIRHNVTVTLYNNAVALTRQPDSQQAAAEAFRQVADRFSHDPDPAIRATAADARSTEAELRNSPESSGGNQLP